VDGITFNSFFPLVIFAILIVSYVYFHKINAAETISQKL
jgi:hypothetical protein